MFGFSLSGSSARLVIPAAELDLFQPGLENSRYQFGKRLAQNQRNPLTDCSQHNRLDGSKADFAF